MYPSRKLPVEEFQQLVNKKWGLRKTFPINKRFKQLCFPKQFEYQLPQMFVREFINPKTPYKSLLVYHKIGSGKTCTAIQIAEQWKSTRRVFIIVPAALKDNLYQEFLGDCSNGLYQDKKSVDEVYVILSHTKFLDKIKTGTINLWNALLIIDEVHNLISELGSNYHHLRNFLDTAPKSLRVVALSATPIVDNPSELELLMKLLRIPINPKLPLAKMLNGFVSYYPGAHTSTFPKLDFKVVNCRMSPYQFDYYKHVSSQEKFRDIGSSDENFYVKSRMVSNIHSTGKMSVSVANISSISCKFNKMLVKLKRARGTVFIYSCFKEEGGLSSLVKLLEDIGYSNYKDHGAGYKRFALWTSDSKKEDIFKVFNGITNQNGSQIKILLGSPSIKEGISLLRVRQVHILEPHWNMSRIDQVIGRAIRFCSHRDVKPERRLVKVFLYIARDPNNRHLIDSYMYEIAKKKKDIIEEYEDILRESAVDKLIY